MTKTGVGEHLVIFKLGALGDAAMLVPSVVVLKRQNPSLKITWICGQSIEGVLKSCSWIDELIVVDDKKIFGKGYKRIQEVLNLRQKISHLSPSHVFFGNPDWRYRALLFGLFRSARGKSGRSVFFPISKKSHIEQYAESLSRLMGRPVILDYGRFSENFLTEESKSSARSKKIILAPGGARNPLANDPARRIPVDIFKILAEAFISQGFEVVLVGAEQDQAIIEDFGGLKITNLINKTKLLGLILEIKNARLIIANDSGPLYLGITSGTPVIGLFSATEPLERIPADESNHKWRFVQSERAQSLACLPCYNGKTYGLCANPICVEQFSVEKILATAQKLI